MEPINTFDPEDWAIFQRSLLLLHSPEIESERKLYNLLKKSIRKHHPTTKTGNKNLVLNPTHYSSFNKLEPIVNEHYCSVTQQDPRLNKASNETMKHEVKNPSDAKDKTTHDNLNALLETGLGQISGAGQQIRKIGLESCPTSKTNTKVRLLSGIEYSTNTTKRRVAHSPSSEITGNTRQHIKPYSKNLSRYSPSPVNLKKIRAVLARGDPFPTHLTKICMNNITPDLQREKL